jgi:threonine/homoserine/homoserine lactone efflux protein
VEMSAVVGFAMVAATLILVPGPDWAYVLGAGTRDHVVGPVVAGILLGYAAITVVVVIGLGALVADVPFALTALTVAGASYLVHLGIRTLRAPGRVPHGEELPAFTSTRWSYVTRGAGVSALNPKGLLLFLSILPQFADRHAAWPLSVQFAILGATFTALCAMVYLPLGMAADRVLGANPAVARTVTKVAGVAMVVVGAALLVERLVQAAL